MLGYLIRRRAQASADKLARIGRQDRKQGGTCGAGRDDWMAQQFIAATLELAIARGDLRLREVPPASRPVSPALRVSWPFLPERSGDVGEHG